VCLCGCTCARRSRARDSTPSVIHTFIHMYAYDIYIYIYIYIYILCIYNIYRNSSMYMYIPLHRAAMVDRVPDQPSVRTTPFHPPSCSWPPFRPRKLIKVQLIKITYFSSIGGARWGGARQSKGCGGSRGMYAACARLRPFFSVFAGASPSPALSRLPSFPFSFSSFFFFFNLLRYRANEVGFLAI